MESLFKRAKAFIGMEEDDNGMDPLEGNRQLDITQVIKPKREVQVNDNLTEIIIYEPKIYEDSLNISGNLRKGKPVLINLRSLDPSEGTRLIDFICGAAYAIDGHMMKIGDSIFLFTPSSVKITDAEERASIGEEITSFDSQKETFFSRQ